MYRRRTSRLLAQREVHVDLSDHLDRLSVEQSRLVDPLFHRFESGRDQQRMAADHLRAPDGAILGNHGAELHHALRCAPAWRAEDKPGAAGGPVSPAGRCRRRGCADGGGGAFFLGGGGGGAAEGTAPIIPPSTPPAVPPATPPGTPPTTPATPEVGGGSSSSLIVATSFGTTFGAISLPASNCRGITFTTLTGGAAAGGGGGGGGGGGATRETGQRASTGSTSK